MNSTKLFDKKLSLFLGGTIKERFERRFYYDIILNDLENSSRQRTIYLEDFASVKDKCEQLGILIIGVETIMDSDYPLTVMTIEEFPKSTGNDWINDCTEKLQVMNIIKDFVLYIDIPEDKIEFLSNVFSVPI